MVDLLKRETAPITEEAWEEIDRQALRVLKAELSARTLVDFVGPGGWELAAVNLGRLEVADMGPQDVPWGIRQSLPLLEVRVPMVLSLMELDSIARGAKDADLGPVEEAARKVALFEETAIYLGFGPGRIDGILPRASHAPVPLPAEVAAYPGAVALGAERLRLSGISGPYALVLGPDRYFALRQSTEGSYPPYRVVRDLLGGPVLMSPALQGGVVLSTAGGDFELTVGQDVAAGYAAHSRTEVELYLTESFTFRVLEPRAAIELRASE